MMKADLSDALPLTCSRLARWNGGRASPVQLRRGWLYHFRASKCYDAGMSSAGQKILEDVLSLPEDERAEIAARLIESLDHGAEANVDEAWAAEIERRCAALDAGEAVASDWADVRRRIESQLLKK